MTKNEKRNNIEQALLYAESLQDHADSVVEDVRDSKSMTEAWKKVDLFYRDIEAMRNHQKCTGSKSFSILTDDVDGHTKYLQGINLPIMVNSYCDENGNYVPQKIAEMHIGNVDGKEVLLITPEIVVTP